jgi:hypothetical protein
LFFVCTVNRKKARSNITKTVSSVIVFKKVGLFINLFY